MDEPFFDPLLEKALKKIVIWFLLNLLFTLAPLLGAILTVPAQYWRKYADWLKSKEYLCLPSLAPQTWYWMKSASL
jgi:hypothetical protein